MAFSNSSNHSFTDLANDGNVYIDIVNTTMSSIVVTKQLVLATSYPTLLTLFTKVESNVTFHTTLSTDVYSMFNNSTTNTTAPVFTRQQNKRSQSPLSKEIKYPIFILNGLLALLGLLGNIFVCLVIIRGRKMYTIANLFLMNLAIADMCVLVVSYPLWIIQNIIPLEWPFGSGLCKIIPSISDAFYGVSLGCMITISIHRYRMILHAMNTQLTFFQAKIIIIFIWLTSLCSISVPLYPVLRYFEGTIVRNTTLPDNITSTVKQRYKLCRSIWPSWSYERYYQIFLTIVWYILPMVIILCTFLRIKCYLQKQMAYEWLQGSEHNVLIANHILGIKKALRMLAPVVIVFAILMLPWNILRMMSVFLRIGEIKYGEIYILVAGTMLVANSVVNPFIYYIMSKEFRIEFRKQFWLLRKYLNLAKDIDEYTIEADQHGRRYVRRFESIVDHETNSNTIHIGFSRNQRMRQETLDSSRSEYTFSNGAPLPNYEELFKDHYNYLGVSDRRGRSCSHRSDTTPLCSIVEEDGSIDLDSKDSGYDGENVFTDKIDNTKENKVEDENVREESVFLCEEVIKETVL